jgi:hypothetical protein
MQYAPEFHTALITVSSILIAVAGIMVTVLVSGGTVDKLLKKIKLSKKIYIGLVLGSIALGIISIVCALFWFVVVKWSLTWGALVALISQSIFTFVPLWRLIGHLDESE